MITDIQMPCSSGLELGKRCRDELGPLPVFIILTSFEDFQYAREAMSFRAADYLVKIDLSPESLTEAVKQAVEQVNLIRQKHPEFQDTRQSLLLFQERFYIKLLNNLFESREQFRLQKEEFEISLDAGSYAAATVQFIRNTDPGNDPSGAGRDIPLNIYSQTLQMFQELLSKYISCHVLALDTHFLAAVFLLDDSYTGDWKEQVRSALKNTEKMLHNYYGVSFLASIGGLVHDALDLSSSYSDSRQLLPYLSDSAPILFSDERSDAGSLRNVFSMSLFRDDISRAFQELDESSLRTTLDTIRALLEEDHIHFSQALDAASSILHFAMTLLSDGPDIVSQIFSNEPDTFGISPNYLSQLFKKHMNVGISEYITSQKIDESRKLLKETNLKIYEISDQLGFESSFYFSKVFKKITGLSPKDFRNRP